MKLSVAVGSDQAGDSAFVVWRGFERSIKKAAEFGYDGVELALRTPDDLSPGKLRTWLKDYHMEVSCITTGRVFAESGLFFTHPEEAVRKQTVEVFEQMIDLASEFGGMVNAGRVRGMIGEGQTRKEAETLFLDTALAICRKAEAKGVTLAVEPVNRYEINFINSLDEGAALLERSGCDRIGLHADVFHMNIEDDRIGDSLVRNGKWIRYVHLADTNRLAPGMGHMDFDEIFRALQTIGYDGWVSMEMLPGEDADQSARQAVSYIRPMMEAYHAGYYRRREAVHEKC